VAIDYEGGGENPIPRPTDLVDLRTLVATHVYRRGAGMVGALPLNMPSVHGIEFVTADDAAYVKTAAQGISQTTADHLGSYHGGETGWNIAFPAILDEVDLLRSAVRSELVNHLDLGRVARFRLGRDKELGFTPDADHLSERYRYRNVSYKLLAEATGATPEQTRIQRVTHATQYVGLLTLQQAIRNYTTFVKDLHPRR
jgi:hypothetical protein